MNCSPRLSTLRRHLPDGRQVLLQFSRGVNSATTFLAVGEPPATFASRRYVGVLLHCKFYIRRYKFPLSCICEPSAVSCPLTSYVSRVSLSHSLLPPHLFQRVLSIFIFIFLENIFASIGFE